MCVIAVVGVAPCQCFSPGGNHTTSPGRISSIGPPSRLHPAEARRDDQGLTQWMRVPCRACAGLEGDAAAIQAYRVSHLKHGLHANRTGEIGLGRFGRTGAIRFV